MADNQYRFKWVNVFSGTSSSQTEDCKTVVVVVVVIV